MKLNYPEIAFRDFRLLMEKRNRSTDDLVDLFRGKIEDPREFFERVMSCQWRNPETRRFEDRSGCVIPYRSVIEFYQQELHFFKDTAKKFRECACGCGLPIFGRQKWASQACKQKAYRKRSETVDFASAST